MASVLVLGAAIEYHGGNVTTNHRPQGKRRPHGAAGRFLGATKDRNETMHARRGCAQNSMGNHASRPRVRGRLAEKWRRFSPGEIVFGAKEKEIDDGYRT